MCHPCPRPPVVVVPQDAAGVVVGVGVVVGGVVAAAAALCVSAAPCATFHRQAIPGAVWHAVRPTSARSRGRDSGRFGR